MTDVSAPEKPQHRHRFWCGIGVPIFLIFAYRILTADSDSVFQNFCVTDQIVLVLGCVECVGIAVACFVVGFLDDRQ